MPNAALIIAAKTNVPPLAISVDGYTARSHELRTLTGGEPVEDGRLVTDHAVGQPRILKLTGSVSDINGAYRPAQAWAAIEAAWKDLQPITVTTEWGTLDNMLLTRAVGNTTGRGLTAELELTEIITVGAATVPAAARSGPASSRPPGTDRGLQPTVAYP